MARNNSNSYGNQIGRITQCISGAKSFAKQLPKEIGPSRAKLETLLPKIYALSAQKEHLRQQLGETTRALQALLTDAGVERARIVRYAEATFGPRDARLREFRPLEGRVTVSRKRRAVPSAVKVAS